jgi:hypothetical protein
MQPLRYAEIDGHLIIEGLLVPYGGSFNGRDSYGTYATRNTDFCLDWFDERPFLYQHGLDGTIRTEPLGRMTVRRESDGLWLKGQVDLHNQYVGDIKQLMDAGALGLSSGAMAHLVEIDERTGEWIKWPLVEGSLTPAPSNLLATVENYHYATAIRAAGFEGIADKLTNDGVLTDEALRAKLSAKERENLDDSDFAYIDSSGDRHLPINDAAHVKAALARFDQTEFESDSAKAAAKKRIMAAAKKFDVDASDNAARSTIRANVSSQTVDYERSFEDIRDDISDLLNPAMPFGYCSVWSCVVATYPDYVIVARYEDGDDCSYWKIPYILDDNEEPALGQAQQMDMVYVPSAARSATGPLSVEAGYFTRHAVALTVRTKDLGERRIREGRMLSDANRKVLTEAHDRMGEAHQALGDLLNRANGMAEEAARAALYATPEARRWQLDILDLDL